MTAFWLIVERDLVLAWRQGGDAIIAVMFFVVAATLFPLSIGPEAAILARVGAGVIWVCALLSTLLSLERLFQSDYEDGSLELLAIEPLALEAIVLAKCLANALLTGVPLILASPLLALTFGISASGMLPLMGSLTLAMPTLTLIGAIPAALTVGARRGGVLLSLLALPLYIPVLIFGMGAVEMAATGMPMGSHFLILGGFLLGALPLGILGAAAALRQALE